MEINPAFLFLVGLFLAFFGKREYGKWYNPISIYSVIWGGMLGLHEMKLIGYPDLRVSTWLLVFGSWGLFVLGSATGLLSTKAYSVKESTDELQLDEHSLARVIFVLCAVGSIAVAQHWLVLIRSFGSVTSALILGNIVYHARIRGEIPGMMPYVADLVLAAVCLSGVYLRQTKKINLVVIIPLILESIEAAAWMGRAKILIAGVLIFSAYSFAPGGRPREKRSRKGRWVLVASIAVVLAMLIGATEGIRALRNNNEGFYYASPTLRQFKKVPFLAPSIYVYTSGTVAVLNKFLQYEAVGKGEKMYFGANTFAPIYRVVSKIFGGGDYVSTYQTFYTVPIDLNTGTYLRELYSDFGEVGALIVPYFLAFLVTVLWVDNRRKPRLWKVVVLAHLFVYIVFSFDMEASRWGYWWDSFIFTLLVIPFIKKASQNVEEGFPQTSTGEPPSRPR